MNALFSKRLWAALPVMASLLLAIGCKKNRGDKDDDPAATPDKVFIAGIWNRTVCYWQDSANHITYLSEPQHGNANDIYVAGKTVYVAGYLTGPAYQPAYWTDGAKTSLSTIAGSDGYATALQVAGSEVHIAGYTISGSNDVACYWKNGVRTDLSRLLANKPSRATAIYVIGSDVYLAGFTTDALGAKKACYWKNGERTDLITDGRTYGEANAIAVSGKSIYTAGFSKKNTDVAEIPCYWTNTTYTALSRSNDAYNGKALGMLVNGADVYIAGYSYPDNSHSQACYWKNGSRTELSHQGRVGSFATDVQVSGDNVYVSGTTSTGPDADIPCYWKNGNRMDLGEAGTVYGSAWSIFVTK